MLIDQDFSELKEVSSLQSAQKLLAEGWKLIDTYSIVPDDFNPKDTVLVYVFGR